MSDVTNPNDAARLASLERRIAVLQAEVRAWRLWYDYPGDSTGMIMELWTNVDKARANTDAQGALT